MERNRIFVAFVMDRFATFCDCKNPVDMLVDAIKKSEHAEEMQMDSISSDSVAFLWNDPSVGEREAFEYIGGLLKQLFGDLPFGVLRVCVDREREDGTPVFEDEQDGLDALQFSEFDESISEEAFKELSEEKTSLSFMRTPPSEYIQKTVSAKAFVDLLEECTLVASLLKNNDMTDVFLRRSYLFSVGDDRQYEEYLMLFWDRIKEQGLVSFRRTPRIYYLKLETQKQNGSDPLEFLQGKLFEHSSSDCSLMSIDISEWMSQAKSTAFNDILLLLQKFQKNFIYAFRIPFVDKKVFHAMRDVIADVFTVKAVSIPPLTINELVSFVEYEASKYYYDLTSSARDVIRARLIQEKSDGRFYGIKTAEKVIDELLYEKLLYDARQGEVDCLIEGEHIATLCRQDGTKKSGMQMLDEFIGIDAIRQRVLEIVAQIEVAMKNPQLDAPCIHMRFVGNPGTGKTTVARVIGKILSEKGVLRNGSFFEHTGREFCGRYVGETAPKTAGMCRDAYGSVLFIDEAYSLFERRHENSNDFGREALDTLVTEMENHRNDLLIIMAGYPDEMEQLMHGNSGLESRMPYVIEFPNYTREQLADIFMQLVRKDFAYEDGFEEAVRAYFDGLSLELVTSKSFSNARFVRNLYERTWGKAAMRCQLNGCRKVSLHVEDFRTACRDSEFNRDEENKSRKVGF